MSGLLHFLLFLFLAEGRMRCSIQLQVRIPVQQECMSEPRQGGAGYACSRTSALLCDFDSVATGTSSMPRKKQRATSGDATDPVAAVVSSSSTSSVAAIPVSRRYSLRLNPPQPRQNLYRTALESIFGLLSFDELRSAMFVSRD